MNGYVFVINGSGGVGKDTFIKYVEDEIKKFNMHVEIDDEFRVYNVSSIDAIKSAAWKLGWTGNKESRDRLLLSEIKRIADEYNDASFRYMNNVYNNIKNDTNPYILFLHIREPHNIERACREFNAKSILVTNKNVEHITSNNSDANVYNYAYDYRIDNNGSLNDLRSMVRLFLDDVFICKEG